jgi:large subunit ribosomal protein L4
MAIKINIYNQKAESVGEMKLADKVFGVSANKNLIHQAVVAQMANKRQVLANTKDRSEVRGGGKKPWAQKGTGRARAGSSRSPIWKGGGVTFGPLKERNFSKNINKKMRQKAIFMALSDKVTEKNFVVLDKFEIEDYKTKIFVGILSGLEKFFSEIVRIDKTKTGKNKRAKKSILVINDSKDEKIKYSGRNIPGVKLINLENINVVDLLKYRNLIMTTGAIKNLEKIYITAPAESRSLGIKN